MKAALPPNEAERLQKLHELDILDTDTEQAFDELVELAAMICQAPIAVVSLIDEQRQWFKAVTGLDTRETHRDLAFCAHAILDADQVMVVEDATLDQRFADNALVTGEPGIRFYAGAPLKVEQGIALGTLCVIDRVPRHFSSDQIKALQLLARQVERLLILHQREAQVRHQTERFDLLSIHAPLLIGELDENMRYVFANHKYQKWFGLTPSSMLGKTPFEVFGEQYRRDFEPSIQRSYGGERVSFERAISDDLQLNISYIPVHRNGKVKSIFLLATDISALKKHQRELELERTSLASVIAGTDAGTWRWNVQTGAVEVNARWAEMLGYQLDEVGPDVVTWRSLLHPEDLPLVQQRLDDYFAGRLTNYDSKFRMRHKQGHWIWIQSRGRITEFSPTGKPEWMSGTHVDITAAEEHRKAVERSEKKLASLYNLSPVAIALNRLSNGEFIECNPEFCRLTGYTQEELLAMDYWQLTPEEYRREEAEQIAALHISGRYGPFEKHYLHKDGRRIAVLLNGVAIDGDNGEKQIWSIVQDITERKRIEQLKNDFVSAVSHELRTPLTSISGALGLALNGLLGALPAKAQEMLGIAQKNCRRLSNLINDLLDMEKLAAGKMSFDIQPQLLLPIVEQSLEANRSYASQLGVSFALQADVGAPVVRIDSERLQQVLANFLSNAVKFSPPQGTVDVRVEVERDRARISVQDHGPGISAEFRARIFQKFSQADSSSSRQRGGTGLGLAISKELIERMGGSIGFHSEPGQGACFFVSFPLQILGE